MIQNKEKSDPSRAWAAHAEALARWLWRFVVRRDVWGGYNRLDDRDREIRRPDGTTYKLGPTITRPAIRDRGKVLLELPILVRHFRAKGPLDVVGLHTTGPGDLSRMGTVEIDWHGPDSPSPAVNERAALGWYGQLVDRGFHPLLWDSNGAGGFHLDVLLSEAVATPTLYHFLRGLVADFARYDLTAPPETFPKQPRLRPRADGSPSCGNWCRSAGRHHTRPHWARVWDGCRWCAGEDAVLFVLGLTGDSPSLLPDPPPEPEPIAPVVIGSTFAPAGQEQLAHRIRGYIGRLPNLAEGQGRDGIAYQLAAWLVRDMALSDGEALPWLEVWDAGNSPPKGQARLAEILGNARRYGQRPVGCGLHQLPPLRLPSRGGRKDRKGKHAHKTATFTLEVNR